MTMTTKWYINQLFPSNRQDHEILHTYDQRTQMIYVTDPYQNSNEN